MIRTFQFSGDIMHDLTFNLREGWEADVSALNHLSMSITMLPFRVIPE